MGRTKKETNFQPKVWENPDKPVTIFCGMCLKTHRLNACCDCNPKLYIPDNICCPNTVTKSFGTLPSQLSLLASEDGTSHSVYAAEGLERGTQFGPLVGKGLRLQDLNLESDLQHIWYAFTDDKCVDTVLYDTRDEKISNWCRHLKTSVVLQACNVVCQSIAGSLYFLTRTKLQPLDELVVFYTAVPSILNSYNFGNHQLKGVSADADEDRSVQPVCCNCCQRFSSPVLYVKHMQIFHHAGRHSVQYSCKICSIEFLCLIDLRKHSQKLHNGKGKFNKDNKFVCSDCGRTFVNHRGLKCHMDIVHFSLRRVKCEKCGQKYHSIHGLRAHVCQYLEDNETFTCEDCNKVIKKKAAFNRHVKTHERATYKFSCDRCGKRFRDSCNLKVHLLSHSGVKPFPCQISGCTCAFTTKQCLQQHYRRCHDYTLDTMPTITRAIPFTVEAHNIPVEDVLHLDPF